MRGVSSRLDRDGFLLVPQVVDAALLKRACRAIDTCGTVAGSANRRRVLSIIPELRELLRLPRVRELVAEVLGEGAIVSRSLLFDKVLGANWNVPWHQDQVVAVKERRKVPGFSAWSVKEGIVHVRPPAELLAGMLTLRFHLDDCGRDSGPLKVLPGSHRHGLLASEEIRNWEAHHTPTVCTAEAGDLLLMRPLLLHASDRAREATRRRVLHVDLASEPLPGGLEWECEVALF